MQRTLTVFFGRVTRHSHSVYSVKKHGLAGGLRLVDGFEDLGDDIGLLGLGDEGLGICLLYTSPSPRD